VNFSLKIRSKGVKVFKRVSLFVAYEKRGHYIDGQLLTGIKDAIDKLQEAQKKKDLDKLNAAKKEILNFQSPNRKTDMIDELKQNIETEIEF